MKIVGRPTNTPTNPERFGGATDEQTAKAVADYLKENPPEISSVYVGSGEMPEGYNIQIDPDGEPIDFVIDPEAIKAAVDEYLEENPPAQGAPGKTPEKYVDYFTPEDVLEIAEAAAGLVEVPDTYTRQEIDAIMGAYITDIDNLVGGGS